MRRLYGSQSCLLTAISDKKKCCVHSGVLTNTGGKVIVRKMAGQNMYKGSNSNGVRSLSLPKWRESFVVSGINDEVNNVTHSSLELAPQPTAGSVVFQWGSPRKE